jgi:putative transposase
MKKVPEPKVAAVAEGVEGVLPAEIQEALGQLVGAAREGLLALSVGVGLSVVHELMERELTEVVGPKGRHDPDRTANRHGHEGGSMTLGGRRVPVARPRIRTADGEKELPVRTYEYFAVPLQECGRNSGSFCAGVSNRSSPIARPPHHPVASTVAPRATSSSVKVGSFRSAIQEAGRCRSRNQLDQLVDEAK